MTAASFGPGRRAALRLMRGARAVMLALGLGGACAAWLAGNHVVLGLLLVVVAEETLECAVVIAALAGHATLPGGARRGA